MVKMELKNRVVIITHENLNELLNLYGELNIDRLSEIVNNHIRVAIDEIKEDLGNVKQSTALQ